MAKPKPITDTPIGPGVLIDDLPIKDKRKVPSTIVQSLEAIRIKLGGDSSYTCDSVQESIDGITNIYDDEMPSSNSILSALNKLGEVIEPGGGGSSDFSTAEVTFISVSNTYGANATTVDNDSIKHETYEVSPQNPVTVTVPLYKGKNILPINCIQGNDVSYMPTTEGSVVFDLDSFGYIVTGNGSITAKGRSIG